MSSSSPAQPPQLAQALAVHAQYTDTLFQNARTKPGEDPLFVPITDQPLDAATLPVRALAFYLPQFHPIPQNDKHWGKGFTEWTNVTRAVPLFAGHEQPRLPGELGFYDLRMPHVMERQVELAKMYGIHGFAFHYYWFAGERVLEKPIEHFLNTPSLDLPFCVNWANENWSRRWDGAATEVIIGQNHSPEDDVAMIADVARYFRDKRYIRVGGKPLFMIYRLELFPDPKATVERWRTWCRQNGIGEIYIASCRSFAIIDPAEFGVDAAVEFPPNMMTPAPLDTRGFVLNQKFAGKILDYRTVAQTAMSLGKPPYKVLRGVTPSWDNTARKPDNGNVFHFNSPELYAQWLEHACRFTLEHYSPDENIVFLNAWNEWAEAAYLEPDRRRGYAFLQATADALRKVKG
ncbi:MAG: glycoside hydrolase family 99-like domain-containing protein [Bdellovibrionales bacterium]